ncbi:MAG: DUF4145 domain-containing protein [Candidatus Heimdallarchaeaceae archaeon]|uniref:DUF4145 domain-containing protein n=1 Tax=Candidatus Heimdallarchaeum endolithica TaxID=2876572 RepID=A0A9Y1FN81_9ARCH|nr:MAG: DUF4145 domain-containing protein [Candidatus Heimdallarchaeum endolithica]
MNYISPEFGNEAYTCPYCDIVSQHKFYSVAISVYSILDFDKYHKPKEKNNSHRKARVSFDCSHSDFEHLAISICVHCNNYCIWELENKKIIFPLVYGPKPNNDLPKDLKDDFNEARSIINLSPRASAALSRLILEKLLKHLKIKGKNLNDMIVYLITQGLNEKLQKAMDTLRVFGNEAVHPGQIDLKDDRETATGLLDLINILVEDLISKKKRIDNLYNKLPQSKRKSIENRVKKTKMK